MRGKDDIEKKGIKILKTALLYLVFTVLLTFSVRYTLGLSAFSIDEVPLLYRAGDAANNILRSREMALDGSFFTFDSIGSPTGSQYYDSYGVDLLLLVIQYCFARIPNFILGSNLFTLSGYYLVGYACLYSLRRLRINDLIAASLSIIYACLYYHYKRLIGHTYLSFYFVAPIAVTFACEIYRGEFKLPGLKKETITLRSVSNLIWLVMTGMTGIYYAFFSCFYILIAGTSISATRKSIKEAKTALISIISVVFGVALSMLPPILFWTQNGSTAPVIRSFFGAEEYSLRFTDLIMPVTDHRIPFLRDLRAAYDNYFGITEASFAAVGTFFSIGIIISLLFIFVRSKAREDSIMRPLFAFMTGTLLVATKGGISTFIGFFLKEIRCYNRICVFAAFIGAVAIGHILTRLISAKPFKVNRYLGFAMTLVLSLLIANFGLLDETTPGILYNAGGTMNKFNKDKIVTETIMQDARATDPDDKTCDLYFLPYMRYPENGPRGGLTDYEPILLTIHDNDLHLSYGAPYTRELDRKLQDMTALSIEDQIRCARDMGYDGILIADTAYEEDELNKLLESIRTIEGRDFDAQVEGYHYMNLEK